MLSAGNGPSHHVIRAAIPASSACLLACASMSADMSWAMNCQRGHWLPSNSSSLPVPTPTSRTRASGPSRPINWDALSWCSSS